MKVRWGTVVAIRAAGEACAPSGTRGRDALRLRLFRGVGRAIEGVLTFHFLGGQRVADLFRESPAQRSGLGAFFELPDRTVYPRFQIWSAASCPLATPKGSCRPKRRR